MKTHEQNTQKHTPGPWRVCQHAHRFVERQDGTGVCEVFVDENMTANARLIAAAPELLQVAIWHRDMLDLGDVAFYERHGFNVAEVMPRTRAAIAKATGEDNK